MIRLVVALAAEARPLIDHFKLTTDPHARGFRVYRGDLCSLVVSGVGRLAAGSASGYLDGLLAEQGEQPWVNIGVAGHPSLPLGCPVLAHKVVAADSGACWYPGLVCEWPGKTAEVRTLSTPASQYQGDWLHEMEAAGFYPVASRFSSSELVHCLKVVSDNDVSPVQDVSKDRVIELITAVVPRIEFLLLDLASLEQQIRVMYAAPSGYEESLRRWHFTASQRHRLRHALRRHQSIHGHAPHWPPALTNARGTEVLVWLQETLRGELPRLVRSGP